MLTAQCDPVLFRQQQVPPASHVMQFGRPFATPWDMAGRVRGKELIPIPAVGLVLFGLLFRCTPNPPAGTPSRRRSRFDPASYCRPERLHDYVTSVAESLLAALSLGAI